MSALDHELHDPAGFTLIGGRAWGRTPRLFKGGGKGGGTPTTPAPVAPAPPAPTPILDTETAAKKKANANSNAGSGRSSLRIDRTVNTYGSSGGTGLNIPS